MALEQITIDYFGDGPDLMDNLSNKVSYLQTACSLMIGVGNLIWVPLAIKYGRRPVYIASFLLMTGTCIWSGVSTSFTSGLVARLLLGTACAAPEIVAPLTLTDLFFLHERGRVMVLVSSLLQLHTCADLVTEFIRVLYPVAQAPG